MKLRNFGVSNLTIFLYKLTQRYIVVQQGTIEQIQSAMMIFSANASDNETAR